MEMYVVTNQAIEQALVAAAARGVAVRVILDQSPDGLQSDAQQAYQFFQQHHIAVHYAPNRFTYDHAKVLVIDDRTAFIGSANMTYDGLDSNREYDVETTNSQVVHAVQTVFNADWTNTPAGPGPRRVLILSPGSQSDLIALIESAHTRLDLEEEEAPDSAVTAALEAVEAHGVKVTLLEAETSSNTTSVGSYELAELARHGVTVAIVDHPYLHAQLIVANDNVFIGSENLSTTSLYDNREIGVVWRNPAFLPALLAQFQQDDRSAAPVSRSLPVPVSTTIAAVVAHPTAYSWVQLTGTVDGVFGSTAYITTQTGKSSTGMELWLGSVSGTVVPGERVAVTGYINTFNGQLEVEAVKPVENLGWSPVPAPIAAKTGQLAADDGLLVTVHGTLSQMDGQWVVNDGSGPAPLVFYTATQDRGVLAAGRTWQGLGVAVMDNGAAGIAPILAYAATPTSPVSSPPSVSSVSLQELVTNPSAYMGKTVTGLQGTVSAVFSAGNFYVAAQNRGLHIYVPSVYRTAVAAGDQLTMTV